MDLNHSYPINRCTTGIFRNTQASLREYIRMSEAIRNAATVTGSAKSPKEATQFVAFLLSAEGQRILLDAGQPPVTPAILKGAVPAEVKN